MSQDPDSRRDQKSPENLLQEAKAHFNRVITIDPGNCVAHIFLDQVHPTKISHAQRSQLTRHTFSQIALIQNRELTEPDPDLSGDEVSSLTRDYHIGNAPKRTKRGQSVIAQAAKQRYEATPPPSTSEDGDN